MKRGIFLVACAVLLLSVAGAAMAAPDAVITPSFGSEVGTHRFNIPSEGTQSYTGGEFKVTVNAWNYATPYMHTVRRPQSNGFATFCVQTTQDFQPNLGYQHNVTISTHTNNGTNRPLQPTVAYLYHQFNRGILGQGLGNPSWAYTYGTGTVADGETADLMGLIWYLQGEPYYMQAGYDTKLTLSARQQAWLTDASNAITTGRWRGLEGVRIMQLHGRNPDGSNGLAAQDLLVETTPEPASLALLAIGALPMLPIVRRRRSLA